MIQELTQDQAELLESIHSVYIDAEAGQYNQGGHDSIYGWVNIPEEWIEDITRPNSLLDMYGQLVTNN